MNDIDSPETKIHKAPYRQADFYGGLAMIAIAAFFYHASAGLGAMEGPKFGAGTMPRLLCVLLGLLGAIIAGMTFFSSGPAMPRYQLRAPLLVTAAVVLFALSLNPLGLIVTSFLGFLFTGLASSETRWIEATIAAAVLTFFNAILFVYLLDIQLRLLPVWLAI